MIKEFLNKQTEMSFCDTKSLLDIFINKLTLKKTHDINCHSVHYNIILSDSLTSIGNIIGFCVEANVTKDINYYLIVKNDNLPLLKTDFYSIKDMTKPDEYKGYTNIIFNNKYDLMHFWLNNKEFLYYISNKSVLKGLEWGKYLSRHDFDNKSFFDLYFSSYNHNDILKIGEFYFSLNIKKGFKNITSLKKQLIKW